MRIFELSFLTMLALVSVVLLPAVSAEETGRDAPQSACSVSECVMIPGGEFLMGMDGEGDYAPVHKVRVDSFCMDKYEVTNAQYAAFCEETDRKMSEFWGMDQFRSGPDFPNYPVIGVSWRDAEAYAQWCGKRLPTEAEWEYAARGKLEGKEFPNGDTMDSTLANYSKSGTGGTAPVGSYPSNGFGLYDMAGNVCEWVSDYYDGQYYGESPSENPKGPDKGKFRMFRGGGWHSGPSCTRVFFRNALPANWVDFNVGFRCAKDPD